MKMALKSRANLFLLVTETFLGENFVKELFLKKKCNFKIDNFVKNIDREANNFIPNNTNNIFEPIETRPRRTIEFKLIESKAAFYIDTPWDLNYKKCVLGVTC